MDSPFANTSIDKLCCPECKAPAMSLVWEPAAPYSTVRVGCSASCGLVPSPLAGSRLPHIMDTLWRLEPYFGSNTAFKSKSEREGQS